MKHTAYVFPWMAALLLAACGQKPEPAAPVAPAPVPVAPTAAAPTEATPAPAATAAPGADAGKTKYDKVCASCHGPQGQGQGIFPKLAGQSAEQIAGKLRDYKAGKTLGKQSALMFPTAKALEDSDIDALAGHIAGLPR